MNLQPVQPSDSKGMPPLSTNNHGVVLVTVLWIMLEGLYPGRARGGPLYKDKVERT